MPKNPIGLASADAAIRRRTDRLDASVVMLRANRSKAG
jgi:hypothetical protein